MSAWERATWAAAPRRAPEETTDLRRLPMPIDRQHAMDSSLRLLLVEDSDDDATLIAHAFKRVGYAPFCERVDTAPALARALKQKPWDVLLCDARVRCLDVPSVLALVHDVIPHPVVVVLSGHVRSYANEQFYSPDMDGLVRKDNLDDVPAIVTSLLRDRHRGN
jgi:CheY-like chemotaxis protein